MRALLPLFVLACGTAEAGGPRGPVVLELFTSQGCSSCPPADQLLAKLAKDPDVETLSFHVDYWNDLGWADPYSQPAWTERQSAYARALGDERVYTPELVIGGKVGLVGNRTFQIKEAIASAERPALLDAKATWTTNGLEVTTTAPAGADVYVAVWESERTTKVPRGENAGHSLANTHIVRRLERVAPAGKTGTITVKLDPSWKSVGAVAFAQRADRRIVASARLPR
jgi:hypothetical protein